MRRGVVAIGNFDGVHRGHQALLSMAREEASQIGAPFGLLTFEPHPRVLFRPEQPFFRLTPWPLKQRLIAAMGADFQLTLDFNRALASLEARDFVENILVRRLAVSKVVTGYDFHFGRGRRGNPELMRRLGDSSGFAVTTVDQVTDDDGLAPFSSSAIRNELRHGRVAEAASSLGYWWIISGKVVEGDRRGRTLGFPTANLALDPGVEPMEGIYAVRLRIEGERHFGVGYVGSRPTFATGSRFLEVYIFDFERDIYAKPVDVEFLGFIRPDEKFASPQVLVAQMRTDGENAANLLRRIETDDPMMKFPLGRLQGAGRL